MFNIFCLSLKGQCNKWCMTRDICACTDLGSPPSEEKSPSTRQTVHSQGATRKYRPSGQFSPPEDGAVRRAVHRNQSLRGLRQVWQRRFSLALLRQHGRPWWCVWWPVDVVFVNFDWSYYHLKKTNKKKTSSLFNVKTTTHNKLKTIYTNKQTIVC